MTLLLLLAGAVSTGTDPDGRLWVQYKKKRVLANKNERRIPVDYREARRKN